MLDRLLALKAQGLIRHLGMATWDPRAHRRALEHGAFDVIQTFHVNTLLNRTGGALYAEAEARNLGICDSGPHGGYILATGPVDGAQYSYSPATPEAMAAARRLQEVCREKGVRLADAAIAFALRQPLVDVVVVASGSPRHITSWVDALESPLTDQDFRELVHAAGPDLDGIEVRVARIQIHHW